MSDKKIDLSGTESLDSGVICVTNRSLCHGDFFDRMEKIVREKPKAVILREKDLTEENYLILAKRVLEICDRHHVQCILHCFVKSAKSLGCKSLHLPLPVLSELSKKDRKSFSTLGASCHSIEDAIKAEKLGCSYIAAGHIFDTDCKKGLPGRGLEFLKRICESVEIPVYAIGGITPEHMTDVYAAGAKGACVMSGLMKCENTHEYFNRYRI